MCRINQFIPALIFLTLTLTGCQSSDGYDQATWIGLNYAQVVCSTPGSCAPTPDDELGSIGKGKR